MTTATTTAPADPIGWLERRARRLSYFTVAYNLLEGLVSVVAGALAGSVALVGFGLDSFVESLSGGVMIWRFRIGATRSHEAAERAERTALYLVGYTFYVLGLYVAYESVTTLLRRRPPEVSALGIAIMLVSLIVMPVLFWAKQRTGRALNSRSLVADSRQTLACVLLSLAVLAGLLTNAIFGFWQADPILGLLIAGYLLWEGRTTIREGKLCAC
jgi:cation diffusion facilitator family transporter